MDLLEAVRSKITAAKEKVEKEIQQKKLIRKIKSAEPKSSSVFDVLPPECKTLEDFDTLKCVKAMLESRVEVDAPVDAERLRKLAEAKTLYDFYIDGRFGKYWLPVGSALAASQSEAFKQFDSFKLTDLRVDRVYQIIGDDDSDLPREVWKWPS